MAPLFRTVLLTAAIAFSAVGIHAGPAAAAESPSQGELTLRDWRADRPATADVADLKLRWSLTTLVGEPYVAYGLEWSPGSRAKSATGKDLRVRSDKARRQLKLASVAVLRAKVTGPGCDGCAWMEFIIPAAVSWSDGPTEFQPVSPPWGKLFVAEDGGYLSASAARRLAGGSVELADLEFAEPRFELGTLASVSAPPKPAAKPQPKKQQETANSQNPDCFIYCD
jgi:hypothetical protein